MDRATYKKILNWPEVVLALVLEYPDRVDPSLSRRYRSLSTSVHGKLYNTATHAMWCCDTEGRLRHPPRCAPAPHQSAPPASLWA
jgi:hypothetical protein